LPHGSEFAATVTNVCASRSGDMSEAPGFLSETPDAAPVVVDAAHETWTLLFTAADGRTRTATLERHRRIEATLPTPGLMCATVPDGSKVLRQRSLCAHAPQASSMNWRCELVETGLS
jgi:hypothetical protein